MTGEAEECSHVWVYMYSTGAGVHYECSKCHETEVRPH